ncbi:MAG: Na/Pi cotransporter family protein [Paludibacteraceae bacterium]|nr:Na/Pi cotransporter family protein [Paludibacteraceae bacterium]
MEFSFLDFLTLVGSLGIFLFGMKMMSEALQKAAGNRLRTILAAMTSNRFVGILTGFLITAIIQSSSATTVMVVSFVNAGLLSLSQAFGVIMGANVGTTITAWIVSLFGFKVDISTLAIPIIAFSVPLLFSKHNSRRYIGEIIMGFSLLFLGIGLLKESVPDISQHPEILEFLRGYTSMGFASVLLFLLVGTLLTIIVQSSSATMAITLIMCSQGWIDFQMAAAMVLGENIGTTITANLAAWSGNIAAKRAAFSHLLFNLFGVLWMLVVFYPFTNFILSLVEKIGPTNPSEVSAFSLSLFHTMFNICNICILVWFSNYIVKLIEKVIKKKAVPEDEKDEIFHLQHISTGLLSTSELSLLQASKEIAVYEKRTHRMLDQVRDLLCEDETIEFTKRYSRIEKYENISDRMEIEIANYLTSLASGRLSTEGKKQVQMKLRIISEIESIGDSCYNIARILQRKREQEVSFTKYISEQLQSMFELVDRAMNQMAVCLDEEHVSTSEIHKSQNLENEINNLRNQLKRQNVEDVKDGKYPYGVSTLYMDIVVECEKIGDCIINAVEAAADFKIEK